MQDERERLKAAGFTDAEIDAELGAPKRPSVRGVAAESSSMQGPGKAPARAAKDLGTAVNAARAVAQGATGENWDEIEAGLKTGFGFGGDYRGVRDGIRADEAAFAAEHPYINAGSKLLGGVAMGGALAKGAQGAGRAAQMLSGVGMSPKIAATAGAADRAWNAAKAGGTMGAITGLGVSNEAADAPQAMALGGLMGMGGGAALSGTTDIFRRARQMVASVGQKGAAGPIRSALQAGGASPEIAGGQKVLRTLGRAGMSVDDLATASATADRPAILSELIPDDQGVSAARVARNLGRSRDRIDRGLSERAAEEPTRYMETVARETGVPEGLDAKTVASKAIQRVEARVEGLYQKSYARPDVSAKSVLRTVEKLAGLKRGRMGLERAGELSNGFDALQSIDPASPMISVRNLHNLRQGVDYALDRAVEEGDAQMVRVLTQERTTLDRAFKQAGGKLARRADQLWEKASAEGESFALGQRSQQATTKQGMVRLKGEARDPEAFRQGAASKQLERVEGTSDGGAGQTRNPVQATMGSGTLRARASLGYSDRQKFGRAREEAEKIVQRLRTKQAVSGNSTTAANLAEMADQFQDDPFGLIQSAATGNVPGLLRRIGERGARAVFKGDNAAQADEMGRLLFAGLPGQQSRDEAIRKLQALAPAMAALYARNAIGQGVAGGAAARALRP